MIALVSVFSHGLAVMAGLTQRLPVGLVPEKFLITTVWNDVVNNRGWYNLSFLLAPHTEWVGCKKGFPCSLPPSVVTLFLRSLGVMVVERSVFLTVHRTVGNKLTTARVFAWCVWSAWHGLLLPRKSRLTEMTVSTDLVIVHIQKS